MVDERRTGESEFLTFIFSDVFSLKWFDWPKVSFEQVISTISIFTAWKVGFGPDRLGSVWFGPDRFGPVRVAPDWFGPVLAVS